MTDTTVQQDILPNDVIVRLTKSPDGATSYQLFLAVNDESILPEMEKTAEFISNALLIMDKPDAAIEYSAATDYAEGLTH